MGTVEKSIFFVLGTVGVLGLVAGSLNTIPAENPKKEQSLPANEPKTPASKPVTAPVEEPEEDDDEFDFESFGEPMIDGKPNDYEPDENEDSSDSAKQSVEGIPNSGFEAAPSPHSGPRPSADRPPPPDNLPFKGQSAPKKAPPAPPPPPNVRKLD